MESFELSDLIPGLPGEIGLECLTRLPYASHPVASWVCRSWHQLLESREFYHHRRHLGYTRKVACLVQALPRPLPQPEADGSKPSDSPSYAITVFDPVGRTWERLDPVPGYPGGLPLFCQVAGCEGGKLVVMGGWDPASYDPVTDVFLYDIASRRWRRCAPMPSKRSFFAMGSHGGRIYVAGGHDENKNALRTAWAYDPWRDEWAELPPMTRERDECEGIVAGGVFWVVSGYGTDSQGEFEGSAEAYAGGEWRLAEGVWEAGRCPRSSVAGFRGDGRLVSWSESDSRVRVGPSGVALGDMTLVTGSEYQGAAQGFYVRAGQGGKFERVGDVPDEFGGFVQSGCCVAI